MKKIILGAAVAFAAIFGGYTASQTSELESLDLLSASDIEAEAKISEVWANIGPKGSGNLSPSSPVTSVETVKVAGEGSVGWKLFGGKASRETTKQKTTTTTYFYCNNSGDKSCQPYYMSIIVEPD